MKKTMLLGLFFALAGCSNATRTMPVIVVEDRPIPSFESPRKIEVPVDQHYLPLPKNNHNKDSVVDDWQRNNFIDKKNNVPLPSSRPF